MSCGYCRDMNLTSTCPICRAPAKAEPIPLRAAPPVEPPAHATVIEILRPLQMGGQHRAAPVDEAPSCSASPAPEEKASKAQVLAAWTTLTEKKAAPEVIPEPLVQGDWLGLVKRARAGGWSDSLLRATLESWAGAR